MTFPKFVVTAAGNLIIAKCQYHRDLLFNDKDSIIGGGWWQLNNQNNTFTLYGSSEEFGFVSKHIVENCIKLEKVFTSALCVKTIDLNTYAFDLSKLHTFEQ
jgi:hypothetical protein